MTDLIFDLAQKAEEYSFIEYGKRITGKSREAIMLEKFAELVAQECLHCCYEVGQEIAGAEVYVDLVETEINKKFDIKE